MAVKCSGKLLVAVIGIVLSGSVGFGAILDGDGVIGLIHSDVSFIDTDIDVLHRGRVEDPNQADVLPAIEITVADSTINAAVDGMITPAFTNVQLDVDQCLADKYSPQVSMSVFMVDISDSLQTATIPLAGPTDIKYSVNTGRAFAAKVSRFTKLSLASPFDFKLVLVGG